MLLKKMFAFPITFSLLGLVLAPTSMVLAQESRPKVALQSIGALEFGPDQTLFVADSLAATVYTPLVTFPLDEVKSKDKLRGKTIAELGWGNIPTDMIAFEGEKGTHVLIINDRRGNMRIKASEIIAAQKGEGITSRVGPREGVEDETVPLGTILQAANFDDDHIALLNRSRDNGALSLGTVPKARL